MSKPNDMLQKTKQGERNGILDTEGQRKEGHRWFKKGNHGTASRNVKWAYIKQEGKKEE